MVGIRPWKSSAARTKFSSLLDRVEKGEEITTTRRGTVVARLVPAKDEEDLARRQDRATEELRSLRRRFGGRGITVDEIRSWIAEGRK
jgi:prevent-host-death family protein